jgi:hypothetical protein
MPSSAGDFLLGNQRVDEFVGAHEGDVPRPRAGLAQPGDALAGNVLDLDEAGRGRACGAASLRPSAERIKRNIARPEIVKRSDTARIQFCTGIGGIP